MGVALHQEIQAIRAITDEAALPRLTVELLLGMGFRGQHPDLARQFAPGILGIVRQVPSLIEAGTKLVLDAARPVSTRFGIASALMYAAIPNNILVERSGSAFGYLDEWLLLQAAIFQYTGSPALSGCSNEQLATLSQFVTYCLPAGAIANLQAAFAQLGQQFAVLPLVPPAQLALMLDTLLQSPVPAAWQPAQPAVSSVGSPTQPSSRGEWTVTPNGATWSNHRGSMYMRFPSGDSVTMRGNNILVSTRS